jgi:hypothetical protein
VAAWPEVGTGLAPSARCSRRPDGAASWDVRPSWSTSVPRSRRPSRRSPLCGSLVRAGSGRAPCSTWSPNRRGDARCECVRLDGRELAASPRGVIDTLRGALDAPPGTSPPAPHAGSLVLLIDAYERLSALDGWIRTWLLPGLPADTPTVLASRDPPAPGWRSDPAWRHLSRVVSLRNLGPDEGRRYLSACGVDPAARTVAA